MESPDEDELIFKYPCKGVTGIKMSKKIIDKRETLPFGEILSDPIKLKTYDEYGIMNTFQFPLGIIEKLESFQIKYSKLKELEVEKNTPRDMMYKIHFDCLANFENIDEELKYTSRLKSYLQNSKHTVNLVICGFIAQSVFLKITNTIQDIPYNRLVQRVTESGKKVNILFVNHPADKNNEWAFSLSSLSI